MERNYEFDNVDLNILQILMEDARIPYTEIAKRLFVSPGTIHVRMKKLESLGIVKGAHLVVDPARAGFDITAFLGIYLEKSSLYDEVVEQLKAIPEIIFCHYTTGNYSMFARIVCRDTVHLKDVLHDKVQKIQGIERTETFISLEESFSRPMKL